MVENLALIGLGLAIIVLTVVIAHGMMTDVDDMAGRTGGIFRDVEETEINGFFE